MRILFALLGIVTGLLLVFGGYRLARLIIPLWGFLAGLSLGGAVIAGMASTPFLGTVLGVFVGLILGAIFALFAYLYYSAAVIVLAGLLGYWLGSGFMLFIGVNPGLLSMLVGLGVGIVVGLAAIMWNAPRYVLIFLSGVAGAVVTIGSILLLFNTIPLDSFSYTTAQNAISNSGIWTIITIALAIVGMVAQVRNTRGYEFRSWSYRHNVPPSIHSPQAPL